MRHSKTNESCMRSRQLLDSFHSDFAAVKTMGFFGRGFG